MKIEKVNDHQIRCTLTKADLMDRELKISELAYGTEKAKTLFRDMMEQAFDEFGFEAEDIPLMIEAIPLSSECIVLIITKVEDPEELDTRFSQFAPSVHDEGRYEEGEESELMTPAETADDILNLFRKLQKAEIGNENNRNHSAPVVPNLPQKEEEKNMIKMFSFSRLDQLIHLGRVLKGFYNQHNSVYKDPASGTYKLVISKGSHSSVDFNKVCNILSEYGHYENFTPAYFAFMEEHFEAIRKEDALQALGEL